MSQLDKPQSLWQSQKHLGAPDERSLKTPYERQHQLSLHWKKKSQLREDQERAQTWVTLELLELGSDSQEPQTLLVTTEDLVLGSLGCMEAKDNRFSGSWTPQTLLDATEELRNGM